MQRRTFLEWSIYGLSTVTAAVLGIPAVAFLTDARNRSGRQTGRRAVAKLSDLRGNIPKEFVIRETRRDAWNLHPDDVIGRVWLVRRSGDQEQPSDPVEAFTNICPHLGCSVNCTGTAFLCPCHGGNFDLEGKRIEPSHNPAPRDMDRLPCSKVELAGQPGEFEIEVEYKRFKTSLPAQVEIQ